MEGDIVIFKGTTGESKDRTLVEMYALLKLSRREIYRSRTNLDFLCFEKLLI